MVIRSRRGRNRPTKHESEAPRGPLRHPPSLVLPRPGTSTTKTPDSGTEPEILPPAGWQAPLIDLIAALVRRWWVVLVILALGTMLGWYKYKTTPPYYRAAVDAILLPREKPLLDAQISTSSLRTSDQAASRETTGALMLPANTELYTAILHSRSVRLTLIDRFHDRLDIDVDDRSDEIISQLQSMAKISGTEEGMINIEVTADDSSLAADLANAMIDEMQNASKEIEKQLLIQQAGFLHDAIDQLQTDLGISEQQLTDFQEKHNIISVQSQIGDQAREIRQLNERSDKLEQDRAALLETYTENSIEVQQIDRQRTAIDVQLEELSTTWFGGFEGKELGRILIEFERLSERVRLVRDLIATLETQRTIFEIRKEQPAGSLAVIRPAVADWVRAGPSKTKMVGLAIVLSALLGVASVLLLEQWDGARADPYLQRRMGDIRRDALGVVGFAARPVWRLGQRFVREFRADLAERRYQRRFKEARDSRRSRRAHRRAHEEQRIEKAIDRLFEKRKGDR